MVNVKESILNSYAVELEVTDAWQFPANYKVFKENANVEVKPTDFICVCTDEEYKTFIEKIDSIEIDKWEGQYLSNIQVDEKDALIWKLIIYYGDGKKIIKRGINNMPDNFGDLEEYLISITEEAAE